MFRRPPPGAILALVGAVASIAGSFLPWAHVTVVRNALVGSSLVIEPSGWNGDGNVVFGLGVCAAVIGVFLIFKDEKRFGQYLRTALLIFGVAVVMVTFWDTTHVSQRFSNVARKVAAERGQSQIAPRVHTRIAPGIILAAAGGVVMVFGAVIDRMLSDEVIVEVDDR